MSTSHPRLADSLRSLPLLLSALLAACAMAPAGPAGSAAEPLPDRDAAGLAAWVDRSCRDIQSRAECREAALARIAEERGIGTAMDVIARLDAGDSEGHILSHMVGIRGYRGAETVAESFAECTPIHQSGCYHGVVQAYFGELRRGDQRAALTSELMDALCAPYRGPEGDAWLLFQCLHGAGHGVMLVHDHHLVHALEACDLLSSGWEREACYGGAFMESIMAVTAPHHAHVGAAAAGHEHGDSPDPPHHDHDAHDHHDHAGHGASPAAEPFPAVDPDDLHHPCSSLHARYQMACYDMQTAVMLHLLDGDIAATAAACRTAPDPVLRSVCHRSLGRDINAISYGQHARSAALCALAAPEDRPSCHTGVVKNVIDVTADAGSGVPYCEITPAGPERQACFRAIGEHAAILLPRMAERTRFCDALESVDRERCLEGAGVKGAAPAPAS
jgi:hypothetical protein